MWVFLFLEGQVARESRRPRFGRHRVSKPALASGSSLALHSGHAALLMRVGRVVSSPVPSPSTVTAAGHRSSRPLWCPLMRRDIVL